MKSDLHKTFGEIFNDDITALREQLLEIQRCQVDREDSLKWARNLRFLDISKVPELQRLRKKRDIWSTKYDKDGHRVETRAHRPKISIPIVEENEEDEPPVYLAVSWKWVGRAERVPFGCDCKESFRYYVKRLGSAPHAISFPDRHMDRIIRVAQSHDITKIWIDTECIYQRDGDEEIYPRDKERGVQVMDLVYADAKMSVGLLTTPLMHQDEVDILASLLSADVFVGDHTKSLMIKTHVDVSKVQMLILRILSDPRWSRAWIFQEDHLASYEMSLLIPHSEHIDTTKIYDFGTVSGELQVKVARFRKCATAFCLAQPDTERWPSNEILRKAKRYKIYSTTSTNACPTTTLNVLTDLCSRSIEKEQDRIAILANSLRFSARLDTSNTSPLIRMEKYSLSATLFALILLNGEILHSSDDLLCHTVQSYIERNQYTIRAPHGAQPQKEQYFVDHCRFRSPNITSHGIQTTGWLFVLLAGHTSRISLDETLRAKLHQVRVDDPQAQVRQPRSILDMLEQVIVDEIIAILNNDWPQSRLVDLLRCNLDMDCDPPPCGDEEPARSTRIKMMAAVVQALFDGHDVRLARLHSAPVDSPPSAMFISPQGWSTADPCLPLYVFTSWDNPRGKHRQERLVSLEVAAYDRERWVSNGRQLKEGCLLKSGSWVNGVWDARRKPMETYTFPLLGTSGNHGQHGTKRKREGHEGNEMDGGDSGSSDAAYRLE